MKTSRKIVNLYTQYQNLTPLGLALCGMDILEKIDRLIEKSDDPEGYRKAFNSLREIYYE